jgi:hypothetical protein
MSLEVTIAIFILAASATLISVIGARRPRELGRIWTPPWHLIQFIGILTMMLMAAHMITLISGQPFTGRSAL